MAWKPRANPPGGTVARMRTRLPLSAHRDFWCPSAGTDVSAYREYELSVVSWRAWCGPTRTRRAGPRPTTAPDGRPREASLLAARRGARAPGCSPRRPRLVATPSTSPSPSLRCRRPAPLTATAAEVDAVHLGRPLADCTARAGPSVRRHAAGVQDCRHIGSSFTGPTWPSCTVRASRRRRWSRRVAWSRPSSGPTASRGG